MAFLSGMGGERRRRMLTDSSLATSTATEASSDDASRTNYNDEALSVQPRLHDLIAWRYTTITLLLMSGALSVVGIQTAYTYRPQLAAVVAPEHLASLDIAARSSLATWFATCVLILASGLSLAIYSVRRHRTDDYHGRYRIWLGAAFTWLLMSLNATTGAHHVLTDVAAHVSGTRGWANGTLWWLAPATFWLGYVSMRLLLDMRFCRAGATFLLLSLAGWSLAIVAGLGSLPSAVTPHTPIVASAAMLGGNVMLLTALLCYARHVVSDASGNLPVRAKKVAKTRPAKQPTASSSKDINAPTEPTWKRRRASRNRKIDPPHPTKPPTVDDAVRSPDSLNSTTKPSTTEWTDGSDADESHDMVGRKLSKAERRRLRKQHTREQRALRS